jgi:hypothetical protein
LTTPAWVSAAAIFCMRLINSMAAAADSASRQAVTRRPVIGDSGLTSSRRVTPNSRRSVWPSNTEPMIESTKISLHSGRST